MRFYIYVLCTLKMMGKFIALRPAENVAPHVLQTSSYFLDYSKQMFIYYWESFCSHQERKKEANQNWIHESKAIPGEACSPPPTISFFFFFTNEFLVRPFGIFLVWSIISSSLRRMPLSPWCIFLTEPSLLGLLYHKSHSITFDNLY